MSVEINRDKRMHSLKIAAVAIMISASINLARPAEFMAGAAAINITPPLGLPLAGYYHERGADGVLDPLFARALVIQSGNDRIALVALDLIEIDRAVTDRARQRIEQAIGIKADHVLISATHTHTGPVLATAGAYGEAFGGLKPAAVEYTDRLPELIEKAVKEANARVQQVNLSVARGKCEGLAFNRRYFMRDGTVGWNPGKLNPNIVMPAGPTDPEVCVLCVDPPNSNIPAKCIASYVNFAMHTDTTGGTKYSADWPGALDRTLAGWRGTNHITLVGNGTCGNINHVDFDWACPQSGPGEQNRIATVLGAAVLQACKSLRPVPTGPVRGSSKYAELPVQSATQEEIDEARAILAATKTDQGGNFMKLVKAQRIIDIARRETGQIRAEVQVLAIGRELAWVGLPGEVFVELGLAIKKRSPFPMTFVVELANDNIGYVPDRRSYAEGNYEPVSSRCAPGSGEMLVDAAVQLLEEIVRK